MGSPEAEPLGRDYYVDPAGDDAHDGLALESPWWTLAHSLPLLRPGDRLNLRGGTYLESELTLEQSGTPGAPITIRAWAGEHPVIDGSYAEFRRPVTRPGSWSTRRGDFAGAGVPRRGRGLRLPR